MKPIMGAPISVIRILGRISAELTLLVAMSVSIKISHLNFGALTIISIYTKAKHIAGLELCWLCHLNLWLHLGY